MSPPGGNPAAAGGSPCPAAEVTTWSAEETEQIGRTLGEALEPGDLVAMDGPLGAGKTTLVRGMALAAGVDPRRVRSPTFVLHHVYRGDRLTLHHLDLYRLEGVPGADLLEMEMLDMDGLLEEGAVAVEWASNARFTGLRPIRLSLLTPDATSRIIRLETGAPERMSAALMAGDAGAGGGRPPRSAARDR